MMNKNISRFRSSNDLFNFAMQRCKDGRIVAINAKFREVFKNITPRHSINDEGSSTDFVLKPNMDLLNYESYHDDIYKLIGEDTYNFDVYVANQLEISKALLIRVTHYVDQSNYMHRDISYIRRLVYDDDIRHCIASVEFSDEELRHLAEKLEASISN